MSKQLQKLKNDLSTFADDIEINHPDNVEQIQIDAYELYEDLGMYDYLNFKTYEDKMHITEIIKKHIELAKRRGFQTGLKIATVNGLEQS